MHKKHLSPEHFSFRTGAYSHGISVDLGNYEMIFLTGQIAMDHWGKAVAPGDYAAQTEYIFKNIAELLAEANATYEDIVKVVIYIVDMARFSEVSAVRNEYLSISKPVSTLVEINKTVKEGCEVEIEVTAIKEKSI